MRVLMVRKTIIPPETQQARAFVTSDDQHEQVFTEESPRDVEAIWNGNQYLVTQLRSNQSTEGVNHLQETRTLSVKPDIAVYPLL